MSFCIRLSSCCDHGGCPGVVLAVKVEVVWPITCALIGKQKTATTGVRMREAGQIGEHSKTREFGCGIGGALGLCVDTRSTLAHEWRQHMIADIDTASYRCPDSC